MAFAFLGLVVPAYLSPSPAQGGGDDLVVKGEEIFQVTAGDVGCQLCHGTDATGVIGPDIRGMDATFIKNALRAVADMEFMELNDDEIEAVAAYLKTLAE